MNRNIHPVRNDATEYCANCKHHTESVWCGKWRERVSLTDCCNRWEAEKTNKDQTKTDK